ncbi:hypothetical protein ACJRO7_011764 [Eucalyptus globulus]|uniref:RING-type E3 ubiquitin transferase n=1 Tax=Eucalyptus globulus TaxID=34317 RepID=A0ABD3LH94_EUCGL
MPSSPGSISPTALDGSYPPHENPLVIFPVVFLCTVFLLFSYSSILQRFHLPAFSRNRAPRRKLLNDFHSHGLDSFTLHNLPTARFLRGLKHLPNCAHKFHVACIDTWFRLHSNCPLRRSDSVVSVRSLMETLDREDFVNERASSQSHY